MALPRFDKLDPDKQESILQIALDEFLEHGYEQASINRIIARAGISKGAMYYYFEGKEDLFATLVSRHLEQGWDAIGPLPLQQMTAESFWPELERFMKRFVTFFFEDNPHLKLWRLCQQLCQDEQLLSALKDKIAHRRSFFSQLIARGQALEVIRQDMPLSLLVQLCDAIAHSHEQWLFAQETPEDPSPCAHLERIQLRLDLIQRLLLTPPQLERYAIKLNASPRNPTAQEC